MPRENISGQLRSTEFDPKDENLLFNTNLWIPPLALAILLIVVSNYNFLLFHTLAEFFAIIIAITMSVVAWHTYPFTRNNFLMYLGSGYFWVAILDFMHSCAYKGINIFPVTTIEPGIAYWLCARFLEAVLLLTAPLFLTRLLHRNSAFILYGIIAAAFILLVQFDGFPRTFIEEEGLTLFKVYSEYLIIALLALALFYLWNKRDLLDARILQIIAFSIVLTMFAELAFTMYVSIYSLSNLIGHIFKLFSFWLIFIAVIRTTLQQPFLLMAREASTYDAVPDATLVVDEEGIIRQANQAACRLAKLPKSRLIGGYSHDLFHPRELEPKQCQICRQLDAQVAMGPVELELPGIGKWFNYSISPIKFGIDTLGMVETIRDITVHKQAEQALGTSAMQLAEAQTIGHMGNWNWDIQADTLNWSDEIYRIFGLQPQSTVAKYDDFINAIHPDDRERVQTAIDNALHKLKPYYMDHRIYLPDGSIRFVHEQGEVRFNEKGDPVRMIGTVQDITERKLSEQMLQKSETRFRATFEQAAVGIAHVSLDGHWLRVNNRLCEITGYSQTELLKLTFQDITFPEDLQTDMTLVNELLAGERENYSMEKRFLNKVGDITWIQLTVALVRDRNNTPDYFIEVIEDINIRKAAETRIQATLLEKDIVLRELHHRVKNNMQVISSLLSLQARYANISNPQEALQESRQRIRAMAMIHERLYGSTDLAAVDFLDYLRYLAERISRIYHELGIDFKIQVSGEQLQLPIDHALPCALISNELMTNAIKHAYLPEQTERLLEIRIANVSTNQPQIIFRDYGRGIDTTLLNDEPATLGLVIVKALIRQLGGTLNIELLNGTVATLTFPFIPTSNEQAE